MDKKSLTARRVKELRESAGLSRRAVAEKLEISPQTVGRWESGEREPSASEIASLSVLYGCDPSYLLDIPNQESRISPPVTGVGASVQAPQVTTATGTVEPHLVTREQLIGEMMFDLSGKQDISEEEKDVFLRTLRKLMDRPR